MARKKAAAKARGTRATGKKSARRARSGADTVRFEAVLTAHSGKSMFAPEAVLDSESLAEYAPARGRGKRAAHVLERLGFRVHHIGRYSISGESPRALWEKVFSTKVEKRRQAFSDTHPELGEVEYLSHVADVPFRMPADLESLVDRAYPQRPPMFFASPLPPRVAYHHLEVPADVAMVLRAAPMHTEGVTGAGVLVAMVDTGFYRHPFYTWQGFGYRATLAPDATRVEEDENGHGTGEAANIFSCAPDIEFIGVKMGGNPTLAFKAASDLHPAVMTNSWGYDLPGLSTLPNSLRPLEAAVIEAVRDRGITVCFSGGNGHVSFPGMMPDVISVGGVYAHEDLANGDFDLEASDYASSFDSQIYAGRHVPDLCGLVGMRPAGVYIMLPVSPGSTIDAGLAGGSFPGADETAAGDGWAVISGTSAASPQIAGICALLRQVEPGLSPPLVKSLLRASARDVTKGQSAMGQPAGEGHDGATGAGLADAAAACRLARSVQVRSLGSVPGPR